MMIKNDLIVTIMAMIAIKEDIINEITHENLDAMFCTACDICGVLEVNRYIDFEPEPEE